MSVSNFKINSFYEFIKRDVVALMAKGLSACNLADFTYALIMILISFEFIRAAAAGINSNLERTLRRKNVGYALVDGSRHIQRPAGGLEDSFYDVVFIFTITDIDMQVHTAVC